MNDEKQGTLEEAFAACFKSLCNALSQEGCEARGEASCMGPSIKLVERNQEPAACKFNITGVKLIEM
jgi:ArsR family metal-binding transcriptional regulator